MLYQLQQQRDVEIVGLLTTVNERFQRVTMHGVRREILQAQAAAAGLPLWEVPIPWPCSNEDYEQRLQECLQRARQAGVDAVAFGDLFLEDVRAYRERQMAHTGVRPLFPLWGKPANTFGLARRLLSAGVRAVVVCVDPVRLTPPTAWLGRFYDEAFLQELPPDVDPCGERGEFHTLCIAGPMFRWNLSIQFAEMVQREGFWYLDVGLAQ
jgi:uncharacterized protein (TIGR00290 family)